MKIQFTKLSDSEHKVAICRTDGSQESRTLNSRSFLFHDLAHLVVESELPLKQAFWGSVASGAALDSSDCAGPDLDLAETLAGPIQVLIKREADLSAYTDVLNRVLDSTEDVETLSQSVYAYARHLRGLWRATNYGNTMEVTWQDKTP